MKHQFIYEWKNSRNLICRRLCWVIMTCIDSQNLPVLSCVCCEGFEATEVVKADRTPDGFTLEVRKQSTIGKFQVLVYNTSGMSFNGTEGAVAFINITAAASTALGEYQGSIADVTMSTDQSFYFDESSFKITVTDKVVLDEVSAAPPVNLV